MTTIDSKIHSNQSSNDHNLLPMSDASANTKAKKKKKLLYIGGIILVVVVVVIIILVFVFNRNSSQ